MYQRFQLKLELNCEMKIFSHIYKFLKTESGSTQGFVFLVGIEVIFGPIVFSRRLDPRIYLEF